MKMSYFLGLGLILTVTGATGWLSGANDYLIDFISLAIILATCLAALICNFGLRGSFSAIAALVLSDQTISSGFRKSAALTVILSGLLGGLLYLVIGVIATLSSVEDPSLLASSIAVSFISLLYGSLVALLAVPSYVAAE
ncbi:MotA/TolQ/ExbB proton channel family protein [uncultured Cohaesibacter sp.]|uniref:MotA/TolQ/ExbB proton channel family protein n=1 Tax=uncultured Cohaesibacter sp. TaxID=1002546 RepID=UPI00292D6507|nr:MotA/TolQ/ExbB proton channel family protein [uncultured Cohaesibacter sp.]